MEAVASRVSELSEAIAGRYLRGKPDEQALTPDADLFLLLDSLDVIRLVSHLEKTYGIEINDDEMIAENLGTVARMAAFIERKRGRS